MLTPPFQLLFLRSIHGVANVQKGGKCSGATVTSIDFSLFEFDVSLLSTELNKASLNVPGSNTVEFEEFIQVVDAVEKLLGKIGRCIL